MRDAQELESLRQNIRRCIPQYQNDLENLRLKINLSTATMSSSQKNILMRDLDSISKSVSILLSQFRNSVQSVNLNPSIAVQEARAQAQLLLRIDADIQRVKTTANQGPNLSAAKNALIADFMEIKNRKNLAYNSLKPIAESTLYSGMNQLSTEQKCMRVASSKKLKEECQIIDTALNNLEARLAMNSTAEEMGRMTMDIKSISDKLRILEMHIKKETIQLMTRESSMPPSDSSKPTRRLR
jgi:hypothetical protein